MQKEDYNVNYDYDEQGRVETATYGNGMTEVNTYDPDRGWLKSRTYTKDTVEKFNISINDYDAVGNIECTNDGNDHNYIYDNLYRLKTYMYDTQPVETYDYDSNGNIITLGGTTFTIDPNSNKITNSGYGYDANGNMTTHNYITVTYDWRNKMSEYGTNWTEEDAYTYDYDSFGERVRKYEDGYYRYYVTSGMNILSEYDDDQALDVEHIYVGIDRIASIVAGDDIYYVCSDQISSSRAVVNESGVVNQRRDYYPFGETEYGTGAVSEFQFSSKECDGTGLYYFGARYHDPEIGRWLSTDPMD